MERKRAKVMTSGVAPSVRIAGLFTSTVAAAEMRDLALVPPLRMEELALLSDAVSQRRQEFAAGRACARHALAVLGAAHADLIPQAGSGPRWPAGYCGSISHTQDLYGAVVGRIDDMASIGLDVERRAPVQAEVLRQIAGVAERDWLGGLPVDEAAIQGLTLFCAKEAFYKCQHPLTGRWLDFHDVELRLHTDGNVELLHVAGGSGSWVYTGRHHIDKDFVLCGFEAQPR